jgi:hypothetical protein
LVVAVRAAPAVDGRAEQRPGGVPGPGEHAFDGSTEADRLDALGDAVRGPLTQERRLLEQADTLDQPIAMLGREAERGANLHR